jgi:hypothetical protein
MLPSELFVNIRAKAANDENLNETLERIFKNIGNALKEELYEISTIAKFATVQDEGGGDGND